MSFDKLIQAATDYFITGAEVHRAALAGGGGKITDLSATKKVAVKATKPTAVEPSAPEKPTPDETAYAEVKASTVLAAKEADIKEAAYAKVETYAEVEARSAALFAATAAARASADDLDGPAINYEEDIRPLLRSKSLANRDKLVGLLASHGVKTGQELTADQYPSFLAALKAL
jgi:hypothetical protein